ncbi:hypothetical protein BC831DRAFT_464821 [Entophlyctis helioformis]|nr:hypothetical protein BC831DRAFT_464821 [Entophlyctis helioformis]
MLIDLIENTLLPDAIAKGDRWMASMLFHMLRKRDQAFYATVMPLSSLLPSTPAQAGVVTAAQPPLVQQHLDPALVIYFRHLERANKKVFMVQRPSVSAERQAEFVYEAACTYERLGCPALAMHIIESERLAEVPEIQVIDGGDGGAGTSGDITKDEPIVKTTGRDTAAALFGGDSPVVQPVSTGGGLDWGESVLDTKPAATGGLDWGEMGGGLGEPAAGATSGGLDWGEMGSTMPAEDDLDAELAAFQKSLGGGLEPEPESEPKTSDAGRGGSDPGNSTALQLTETQRLRLLLEKGAIKTHTWILVMRVCQAVYHSAGVVSDNMAVLKADPVFADYFAHLRQGFATLSSMVDIPPHVMDRILSLRYCPLRGAVSDYNTVMATFMAEEANTLARLAGTVARLDMLTRLTSRMLRSFSIWLDKAGSAAIPDAVVAQTTVTGYVVLALTALESSHTNRVWWIVAMCDRLFDVLLKNNRVGLSHLLGDLLADHGPLAHPEDDDHSHSHSAGGSPATTLDGDAALFDEFGLPLYRASSPVVGVAVRLIHVIVLRHVGLTFEHYLERLKEVVNVHPTMDDTQAFLAESVMRGLSGYLLDRQTMLATDWTLHAFDPSLMKAYLYETPLKAVWELLKRSLDIGRMVRVFAPDVPAVSPSTETGDAAENDGHQQGESGLVPGDGGQAGGSSDWTAGTGPGTPSMSTLAMPSFDSPFRLSTASSMLGGDGSTGLAGIGGGAQLLSMDIRRNSGPRYGAETTEIVYRGSDHVGSFAVNPLDANEMAIVTAKGIREIDMQQSIKFYERRGSFGNSAGSMDDLVLNTTGTHGSASSALPGRARAGISMTRTPSLNDDRLLVLKHRRNMSADMTTGHLKRAFSSHLFARDDSAVSASNGQKLKRKMHGVTTIESHRSLNYYLAGMGDAASPVVNLYQFGQPAELLTYALPESQASVGSRLTRCHFDPFGVRFGAGDSRGDVHIWRFDSNPAALRPAITLRQCHVGPVSDFVFMNSTTTLATAGVSSNHLNVSVWDTLVPPSKSKIKCKRLCRWLAGWLAGWCPWPARSISHSLAGLTAFQIGEAGIVSLVYSPQRDMLIAGGKRGYLYVIDVRQGASLVNMFRAHDHAIKSLAIDPVTDSLFSGSKGEEVKIWDLQALGNAEISQAARGTIGLGAHATSGTGGSITELSVSPGGILYSCLSSGTVARTVLPRF